MRLLSVNVSRPKQIVHQGQALSTGIFKEPAPGRVLLRALNLEGDGQADRSAHGGIHKAVYAYPFEHYRYWSQELGRKDFRFGQFGENFTVAGMPEDGIHVGDVFRIGPAAVVEVTQPRVPCFKLAIKMDVPDFAKRFLASGRVGFYLRVLAEGEVGAGDVIERLRIGPEQLTIGELVRAAYLDGGNLDPLRKAIRIPALSPGWRSWLEEKLARREEHPVPG